MTRIYEPYFPVYCSIIISHADNSSTSLPLYLSTRLLPPKGQKCNITARLCLLWDMLRYYFSELSYCQFWPVTNTQVSLIDDRNLCAFWGKYIVKFLCYNVLVQVDGLNSLHAVKSTPNRFTKTSQGRSWNTGNGSPDAICFSVDKPGVVLVGFCVYGGGGIHEYELEVLADDVRAISLPQP